MKHISIIVPIFHGRKYIDGMIAQLEKCEEKSAGTYTLELILVNDDPAIPIGCASSEKINIKVLETDKNRGIHASRVRGLKHCAGDYILFLDQDDRITPDYFCSQFSRLESMDAVVCRLLHEGRQFYDVRMPFEQVITRDYIISVRNPIISPGQVLIRKSRIPTVWKETELKNNGADDWFLWLCMLAEGSRFALNHEIVFEHVVEGNNESGNVNHMIDSERELYQVIEEKRILEGSELKALYTAVQKAEESHIKLLSKFQRMFFLYNRWMMLDEQGISLEDYLAGNHIHSVAVYGFSYIGKRLYGRLKQSQVCIKYFIDMNAEYLKEDTVPIFHPDETLMPVDMIIISLVDCAEGISKKLREISDAKICTIMELIEKMELSGGTENAWQKA